MVNQTIKAEKIKLKDVPSTIGVYIFKKGKTKLYIGKSVNLKARLISHFEASKVDPKANAYVTQANTIEYIPTDSEFKALILESILIQKYKPKYNVRWRDDKSYLYIKVTIKDTYPKFFITRREEDKKAIYFGPFPSVRASTNILREIRRIFPFCTNNRLSNRRCFYAKIKQCDPCPNDIEKIEDAKLKKVLQKEYKNNIRNVIKVLEGKSDHVLKNLYKYLDLAKQTQDYESAITLRNRIFRLEGVILRRKFGGDNISDYNQSSKRIESLHKLLSQYLEIDKLTRIECFDMSTLSFKDSTASMVVFTEGLSDKKEYKRFKIRNVEAQSDFEMIEEVLHRRLKHDDWPQPDLIVIDGGKPQLRTIQKVLALHNKSIPLIGIAKRPDRVIIGDESMVTIRPPRKHAGLLLLQSLRDESHRFAKKYHSFLRNKKMMI